MINNYQLIIEYDGTNYVGWQSQKNGKAIQDRVQNSIKKLLKEKVKLIGSGRTDAGVHAIKQYANFFTKKKIKDKYKFLESINFFLKDSLISVLDIIKKNKSFHSRFSAKKRIYKYIIINRRANLSINKNKSWLVKKKLNIDWIKRGSKILIGTHDFTTFRSSNCGANSPIKKIDNIKIEKYNEQITLTFISKSFLKQQVRSMVGCLKYLGEGKWSLGKFRKVLKSKNRSNCAPPAPACGLYLFDVIY